VAYAREDELQTQARKECREQGGNRRQYVKCDAGDWFELLLPGGAVVNTVHVLAAGFDFLAAASCHQIEAKESGPRVFVDVQEPFYSYVQYHSCV